MRDCWLLAAPAFETEPTTRRPAITPTVVTAKVQGELAGRPVRIWTLNYSGADIRVSTRSRQFREQLHERLQ